MVIIFNDDDGTVATDESGYAGSYPISQPIADAPSTAADAPSKQLVRNFALPRKTLITFSSYARRIGSIISSPALVTPPKKMNASGLENVAKSAHAFPSISPVNS